MGVERNYFSRRFVQTANLSFTYPTHSTWQIVRKMTESYSESSEAEFEEDGVPAVAEGLFLCTREGHPDKQAHMRVYMQIPYQGTEYEGREERERQAIDEAGETLFSEVEALKAQAAKHSRFTPPLLAYKQEKQGDDGIIPGGFICYLIWKPVDGLRLGNNSMQSPFWSLPPPERADVREAFKVAYEEAIRVGYLPYIHTLNNLVWNPEEGEIYIVDFKPSLDVQPYQAWRNKVFLAWGLAELPPHLEEDFDDSTTDGWLL